LKNSSEFLEQNIIPHLIKEVGILLERTIGQKSNKVNNLLLHISLLLEEKGDREAVDEVKFQI